MLRASIKSSIDTKLIINIEVEKGYEWNGD